MACRITILPLYETQEGTIGNDWKWDLEVRIFSGRRIGQGTIGVRKHNLDSGQKLEPPPGLPEPLVLPGGEPGGELRVELRLSVAEVDLFENDTGEVGTRVMMTSPKPGEPPVVHEELLSVAVVEQPSGVGSAVFELKLQLTIDHE